MTDYRPNYIALPHIVEGGMERRAEHFNDNFRAIADAVEKKLDRLDQRLPEPSPPTGGHGIRSRGDGVEDAKKRVSDLYFETWADSAQTIQDFEAFHTALEELINECA